ncbi:sulfate transport system permease protein [Cohaesibacter marisflavi]|uniref:Sulfate transport system permease protein CysT n=1 Tax=Cohaesibacter marisflavi TaxID=655353 RepID=A0A1I4ZBA6_9HYPH|nr:sulfate ABC transporter permease subunit CysT [Cohaesibacter marisflavi]SFN47303.1 sulfate transport system permease protein [Cohaesibacter marisflavi]
MTATVQSSRWHFREPGVIPGFRLTFGFAVCYLSLVILIPLSGLVWHSSNLGWDAFWALASDPRTIAALKISFGSAVLAALINTVFGLVVAWVLVRYRFPGRRIVDAVVDLPFALPTAVAGIALATLYAPNGMIGAWLADFGFKVAFTPAGIVVALVFIGLPFIVRTVQPVLEEVDREIEEAAATLGASRLDIVRRVLLPGLLPAILTGFAMAMARGIGEYGSVIFIAGNIPYVSEIAPLLIVIRLEEFNYAAATAVGVVMLSISFLMLLIINLIQAWSRGRFGHG